eukprot:3647344-Prymnesium_polylepis.1
MPLAPSIRLRCSPRRLTSASAPEGLGGHASDVEWKRGTLAASYHRSARAKDERLKSCERGVRT